MNPTRSSLPDAQHELGRYRLLYRFAGGGMASLYLARLAGSNGFEKLVAIKVMHEHLATDEHFVQMFVDEARLASRIAHPNVVQIHELGRASGTHYIVMEYVEGENVCALLRRHRPGFACSARIVADTAAALHAAHELHDPEGRPLDVVHRDVSPDNILISYDGTVKVTDFGVARARDSLHHSEAGTLKGKFAYMAPEQVEGQEIDRRVDVFALGIVLYEMTTWRRLFRQGSDAETLQAVRQCRVPPPSSHVPSYPPELERIVMQALQRDPAQRYQSAQELQHALGEYLLRSGDPALASALGDVMTRVFGDQMREKRALLRELREQDAVEVFAVDDVARSAVGLRPVSAYGAHPAWLRTATRAAAQLVALLAVIVVLTWPRPVASPPLAAADAPRTTAGAAAVRAPAAASRHRRPLHNNRDDSPVDPPPAPAALVAGPVAADHAPVGPAPTRAAPARQTARARRRSARRRRPQRRNAGRRRSTRRSAPASAIRSPLAPDSALADDELLANPYAQSGVRRD